MVSPITTTHARSIYDISYNKIRSFIEFSCHKILAWMAQSYTLNFKLRKCPLFFLEEEKYPC